MRCPHCMQEHPQGSRFCPVTGAAIVQLRPCPHCGQPVVEETMFCPFCGERVKPRINRVLAAGLAVLGVLAVAALLFLLLRYLAQPDNLIVALLQTRTPTTAAGSTATVTPTSRPRAQTQPPTATPAPPPTATPTLPPTRTLAPAAALKWSTQVVDPAIKGGQFSSIAIDASGSSILAYLDDGNDKLRVASLAPGSRLWNPLTMPDPNRAGWFPSVAINRAGHPALTYWTFDKKTIGYFYLSGGRWLRGPSLGGVSPTSTSLGFDAQDRPLVVFLDKNDGVLKSALLAGYGWVVTPLERAYLDPGEIPGEGANASMAVDSSGTAHIVYFSSNGGLKYLRLKDGTPTSEVIQTGTALYLSLALDASGSPAVSFYDPSERSLKLAIRQGPAAGSGGWTMRTVDAGSSSGQFTALKIDPQGRAHISYYDAAAEALKYAWVYGDQQEITTLDRGGVGKWTALALDASGLPRVSYYDERSEKIIVAWATR